MAALALPPAETANMMPRLTAEITPMAIRTGSSACRTSTCQSASMSLVASTTFHASHLLKNVRRCP
jgi:hypothetical protein